MTRCSTQLQTRKNVKDMDFYNLQKICLTKTEKNYRILLQKQD